MSFSSLAAAHRRVSYELKPSVCNNALVEQPNMLSHVPTYPTLLQVFICYSGSPLLLVEYAVHGNLRDFLLVRRPVMTGAYYETAHVLSVDELASFGYQVARGMEYITSKNVRHLHVTAHSSRTQLCFQIKKRLFLSFVGVSQVNRTLTSMNKYVWYLVTSMNKYVGI